MLLQGDAFDTLGKIFGVGGIGLGALWIVMRSRFWKNGNGSSGQLTEAALLKMQMQSEERLMSDIRSLADARMLSIVKEVTEPIVREIRGLRDDVRRTRD